MEDRENIGLVIHTKLVKQWPNRSRREPRFIRLTGEPGGTRTRDPVIKSHMLYQLSYRPWKGNKRSFPV
jgi:hypothetical protein